MKRPPAGQPLPAGFYARDTERVARDLLGCVLGTTIRGRRTAGKIVETEAYVGPHDPAAHGYGNRRSRRNAQLFGPPGMAYVYFVYGMHWCFNAVTEREGYPAAVLVRALEPLDGLDLMAERRGTTVERDLCAGPGRLCEALAITGAMDGLSLDSATLNITGPVAPTPRDSIVTTARIGITRAAEWPLRFCLKDSRFVSRGPIGVRTRKKKTAPGR